MNLSCCVFPMAMLTVCAVALGQTANQPVAAVSDAQKTFALMKTLAGN